MTSWYFLFLTFSIGAACTLLTINYIGDRLIGIKG